MKNKHDLSRREFIRNSMMAGGAMLLSGVLPSQVQTSLFPVDENPDSFETDGLLRGVSDIHLHAAPIPKPVWEMNWSLHGRHIRPAINPCCS